jgi:uncharacterized integral membrane protein
MDDDSNVSTTSVQISKTVEATIDSLDMMTGLDKEDHEAIWKSRTKMAWVALWGIILPTIFIILAVHSPDIIEKLGVLMSWYYLALASIVGAYFGFKAWAAIKGK